MTLTPASLSFPSETIGAASPAQPVTLTVVGGNTAISISSIATQGDFAQTNNCPSSIPVGSGCTINVTFKPTAAGVRNGSLVVTDNATGSPQQVSLTGTGLSGTATVTLTPASLSFPSETIGAASPAQSVTLTVVGGNTALSISSIATQGDFAQTNNCPSSIPVGSGCTINATFKPTAAGVRNGSLVVTDNATGSPQLVSLTGTGLSGILGLAVAPGGSS